MKFIKVIAQFHSDNMLFAEEMICDMFFSLDLSGVVCDVPLEEPDEGFGTNTLTRPAICSITGYLPMLAACDQKLEKIREKASALSDFNITVTIKTETVDEEDWAEAWKAYFDVTRITDRITVKPEWKAHAAEADEIVIHLDPGMAFGTGTHPTTAMCIQMIEAYLMPGSTFLDIGTGSGILMVAAAKLGAKHLTGIDTDEVAIKVARENLVKNQIDSRMFDLACTTLDQTEQKPYDLIAANIIAQVIIRIIPQISDRMAKDATIILSGIIREHQKSVQEALFKHHLNVVHEAYVDEWVTLAARKIISGPDEPRV